MMLKTLHWAEAPAHKLSDRHHQHNTPLLLIGDKLHGDGVHTVASVGLRKPFALEYVAQMGATMGADNLDTHAIGIRYSLNGTLYLIVEGGPSAARIKLALRAVEGCTAALAHVGSLLEEIIVLTGEWAFGCLTNDYGLFFGS